MWGERSIIYDHDDQINFKLTVPAFEEFGPEKIGVAIEKRSPMMSSGGFGGLED